MKRIERLINLIAALLETERPLTAAEIRESIAGYDQSSQEAFRRAFERDKEHLRAMGVPLETVVTGLDPASDQPDGYIIPKDRYYLPELKLEEDELAALRLAAEAISGAGGSAESGLLKLSVDAEGMPTSGPRARWGADLAAEQPHLGPLYGALIERRPVSFTYRGASGSETERALEVYALIHRRGNWYAVGRDRDKNAVRAFRLSRFVTSVTSQEGAYSIPEDFDPATHLKGEAFEIGASDSGAALARVRVDPRMRWWVEQNMSPASTTALGDGGLMIELPMANVDALVSWALGFGPDVEIVEPEDARRALVEHLRPYLEGPG